MQNLTSKFNKSKTICFIIIFFLIPSTIFLGINFFDNSKYMFISALILLYTMIPFFVRFEQKTPKSSEIMLIAGLISIIVLGRIAFFFIPQFKPVLPLVIITGVCLGAEQGFLVGSMSCFVSNFYFGQGPHTPWQMFVFGLIGFLAGILYNRGILKATKLSMSIYGVFSSYFIFGLIMNPSMVIMYNSNINLQMILFTYVSGFLFDTIQAIATVFFIYLIGQPMIEILDRIKRKYGFYE